MSGYKLATLASKQDSLDCMLGMSENTPAKLDCTLGSSVSMLATLASTPVR